MKTQKNLMIIALSAMITLLGSSISVASDNFSESFNDSRMEKMIDLSSEDMAISKNSNISSAEELIPFVYKEGNYLMVNFLNIDQEEVKFIIEDSEYFYLESNFGSGTIFEKKFDISNLPKSYSTVAKMIVGDNTFYHIIEN